MKFETLTLKGDKFVLVPIEQMKNVVALASQLTKTLGSSPVRRGKPKEHFGTTINKKSKAWKILCWMADRGKKYHSRDEVRVYNKERKLYPTTKSLSATMSFLKAKGYISHHSNEANRKYSLTDKGVRDCTGKIGTKT